MNALRRALTDHRDTCASRNRCTRTVACWRYLAIVREHTEPRKRWDGPVAPRTILSVRENPGETA